MENQNEHESEGNLSAFSPQSFASNETVMSSPSFSDLDNTNTVSKKQKQLARKQRDKIRKMEKRSEKKKLKNKISKEDYFNKQLEYRAWLNDEKKINLDDLSPGKAKHYFKKFAKKWNKRQLSKHYYRGGTVWAVGSPSTQSLWAMPCTNDLTPGSLPEEAMVKPQLGEPDTNDSSFATFGKKAGRRALKELEKRRLLQLEKEAEQNFGKKRSIEHVYDEPMSPNIRRALAHDYDVPDIEVKNDKRDYDTPISPRPLNRDTKDKENCSKLSIFKFGKRSSRLLPVPAALPSVSHLPSPPLPPPPPELPGGGQQPVKGWHDLPEHLPSPPPPPPEVPEITEQPGEVYSKLPEDLPSPPPPITSPRGKTNDKEPKSTDICRENHKMEPVRNVKKKPPPVPKRSKSTRPVSVHVMQASYTAGPDLSTPSVPQLTPIVVRRDRHLSGTDWEDNPSEESSLWSGTVRRTRPLSGHYQSIISGGSRMRNSSSGSSVSSTGSVSSTASFTSNRSDISASRTSFDGPTIRRRTSRKLAKKDSYCAKLEGASYVVFEKLAAGRRQRLEKRAMTPEKVLTTASEYDVPQIPPVPTTHTVVVCENGAQKTVVVSVTPGKSAKPVTL